jgi:hypothetical protein
MDDQKNPAKSALSVFFRSSSIQQDRIREAQYQNLEAKAKSNALQGLFFIHLKQDLQTHPLDWINCDNPSPDSPSPHFTDYGIDRSQQRRLAEVRTDLDSFTEVEAYALMASGYLMTDKQLKDLDQQHKKEGKPGTWGDFKIYAEQQRDWEVLKLKDILAEEAGEQASEKRKDLELQLNVGSQLFFKAWQLIPWLKIVSGAAAVLIVWLSIKMAVSQWDNTLFSISVGKAMIALLGFVAAVFFPALKWSYLVLTS